MGDKEYLNKAKTRWHADEDGDGEDELYLENDHLEPGQSVQVDTDGDGDPDIIVVPSEKAKLKKLIEEAHKAAGHPDVPADKIPPSGDGIVGSQVTGVVTAAPLRVRVLDVNGAKPIKGAVVRLCVPSGTEISSRTTDADGYAEWDVARGADFLLVHDAPGGYVVVANSYGQAPPMHARVHTNDGQVNVVFYDQRVPATAPAPPVEDAPMPAPGGGYYASLWGPLVGLIAGLVTVALFAFLPGSPPASSAVSDRAEPLGSLWPAGSAIPAASGTTATATAPAPSEAVRETGCLGVVHRPTSSGQGRSHVTAGVQVNLPPGTALRATLDGPGGTRDAQATVNDAHQAFFEFPISSYGTYAAKVFHGDRQVGGASIPVGAAARPCDLGAPAADPPASAARPDAPSRATQPRRQSAPQEPARDDHGSAVATHTSGGNSQSHTSSRTEGSGSSQTVHHSSSGSSQSSSSSSGSTHAESRSSNGTHESSTSEQYEEMG